MLLEKSGMYKGSLKHKRWIEITVTLGYNSLSHSIILSLLMKHHCVYIWKFITFIPSESSLMICMSRLKFFIQVVFIKIQGILKQFQFARFFFVNTWYVTTGFFFTWDFFFFFSFLQLVQKKKLIWKECNFIYLLSIQVNSPSL